MYLKGPLVILGQEQQKTSGVLASPTQPPSILLPGHVNGTDLLDSGGP